MTTKRAGDTLSVEHLSNARRLRFADRQTGEAVFVPLSLVRALTVDNVRLTMTERAFAQYERSTLSGPKLEDGLLRNIHRRPAGERGQAPVVALHDCQRVQWER